MDIFAHFYWQISTKNIIIMVQLNVSPHQYRFIFVKKWLRKKSIWRSQRKHKTQNIVPYGHHNRPAIKEVQGSNLTRVQSLRHRRPTRATWFEIFREIERRWEYWSPDDDETNFVTKLILPEYNCRKIVKVKMTKIFESGANMSTWKQLSEYLKSCIKI